MCNIGLDDFSQDFVSILISEYEAKRGLYEWMTRDTLMGIYEVELHIRSYHPAHAVKYLNDIHNLILQAHLCCRQMEREHSRFLKYFSAIMIGWWCDPWRETKRVLVSSIFTPVRGAMARLDPQAARKTFLINVQKTTRLISLWDGGMRLIMNEIRIHRQNDHIFHKLSRGGTLNSLKWTSFRRMLNRSMYF